MVRDIEPTGEPRTLEEAYAALDLHIERLQPETAEWWAFMDQVAFLEAAAMPETTWMSSRQAEYTTERITAITIAEGRMQLHNEQYPKTYAKALQALEMLLTPIETFEVELATADIRAQREGEQSRGVVRYSSDVGTMSQKLGMDRGHRTLVDKLVEKRNGKVPPLTGGKYSPNLPGKPRG